jgi:hypothetical protein
MRPFWFLLYGDFALLNVKLKNRPHVRKETATERRELSWISVSHGGDAV